MKVRKLFLFICQVRDLLSKDPKNKLDVKEHKESGVYVKGLNAFVVKSVPELQNVLAVGKCPLPSESLLCKLPGLCVVLTCRQGVRILSYTSACA